jgi:hypothetical protein
MLDLLLLQVHMHQIRWRAHCEALFRGDIPSAGYVVLCCHGLEKQLSDMPEEIRMGFHIQEERNGAWSPGEFGLTPNSIPDLVRLPGRTALALGCGCGREPLARAFLSTGVRAYIGSPVPVDQDATAMFATAFFYHLLSPERDSAVTCSEREAVERAARLDPYCREATD